jgi:hypothetical protein
MTTTMPRPSGGPGPYGVAGAGSLGGPGGGANLADILERVLDKGVVIAGDIRINLLDIELLTIKIRLLVASVDKAREMGIDWWEHDPALSSGARRAELDAAERRDGGRDGADLAAENERLRERLAALERRAEDRTEQPAEPSPEEER